MGSLHCPWPFRSKAGFLHCAADAPPPPLSYTVSGHFNGTSASCVPPNLLHEKEIRDYEWITLATLYTQGRRCGSVGELKNFLIVCAANCAVLHPYPLFLEAVIFHATLQQCVNLTHVLQKNNNKNETFRQLCNSHPENSFLNFVRCTVISK